MGRGASPGRDEPDISAPDTRGVVAKMRALLTHEARRFLLPLAVLTVISTAGTAAAPSLSDQPLVLVALSPRLTFLTLAADKVALVPFLAVGLIRLCLADPFHFALGRRHGAGAMKRIPTWLRSMAGRSIPLLVFLRPNGTNLAIAGASPTNRLHVALADVVGTAAYLVIIHTAGTAIL